MATELLHWFIVGFGAGLGFALAHWVLGKILK